MIAKVTGQVIHHGVGFVIVDCGDLGYKVALPEDVAHGQTGGVTFFTHEAIRDDQRELFGFLTVDALELFWRLTSVSGVGPRSGQKIVFAAPVARVKENIMKGNVAFLTNVPGIGKKTAQKIILELKGTLAEEPSSSASVDADALEALVGLGYQRKQAEDVLAMIDADSSEERVTKALRMMGR
ncbi:Holliday junction DNA helicase RuvA [Candidatus Uhrbacteria bacterium RIFOXYB12_FULL_58_10]|uniref:Holliday junction branch migration complex subunit RuvA n=1 Tax=Candidatus Uhrbacteria bacterium RIFOXYB2_FULL_57_15 TaxID=1802422 RepID=A0A1F7W6X9_9BACT|nr:MAG: Holliday junction DNA helicase RuvA [Candidatus Uhrbacteria bacterium RIFOXYB12_FULL_58_10]OGL98565.1 MAG: Holliday junction DNA helicase RuvA [Candidatus Uhrbacteria bacterium RIFOXYB2_FULL_57_15]OGL99373.1 MAG: Holliday junction DNA helicase RuvA [Candidatus Uhrbacteria bacterium RIFOXYC12_FULL_57_11]